MVFNVGDKVHRTDLEEPEEYQMPGTVVSVSEDTVTVRVAREPYLYPHSPSALKLVESGFKYWYSR